jgi:hypothetical protein
VGHCADDDHLGNQDGGDVDEAELDEIEVLQHKAGSPSRASAGLSHQAKCNDCGDPILVVERYPEGAVHLGFPVVAAYVADYPEQALVTCTRYSQTCPKCSVSKDELSEHVTGDPRHQEHKCFCIEG